MKEWKEREYNEEEKKIIELMRKQYEETQTPLKDILFEAYMEATKEEREKFREKLMDVDFKIVSKKGKKVAAEKSALGSMMLDKEAVELAKKELKKQDFMFESHRIIFTAMIEMKGEVDIVTLIDYLKKNKLIGKIGGDVSVVSVASLLDEVPTSANMQYYINILKEEIE